MRFALIALFALAVTPAFAATPPRAFCTGAEFRALDFWLPFLSTYRTMCLAPSADFRRVLEDVRELRFAA